MRKAYLFYIAVIAAAWIWHQRRLAQQDARAFAAGEAAGHFKALWKLERGRRAHS